MHRLFLHFIGNDWGWTHDRGWDYDGASVHYGVGIDDTEYYKHMDRVVDDICDTYDKYLEARTA